MTKEQIVSGAIVTLIATFVGWLTNRASNKASVTNVNGTNRVEMEKEAYERARKLDTETINRQDAELKELEEKYDKLKARYDLADEHNQKLNDDVGRMTLDNYQVHRENNRIIEINDQLRSENERLRRQGDILMRELNDLRERVLATFPLQQGNEHSPMHREDVDTNPMMPEVSGG